MSGYLEWCLTIITYVGFTLGAMCAALAALAAAGFLVMGVINLIDEFRP